MSSDKTLYCLPPPTPIQCYACADQMEAFGYEMVFDVLLFYHYKCSGCAKTTKRHKNFIDPATGKMSASRPDWSIDNQQAHYQAHKRQKNRMTLPQPDPALWTATPELAAIQQWAHSQKLSPIALLVSCLTLINCQDFWLNLLPGPNPERP